MKKSKFKVLTAITTMFTMVFGMFAFSGKSYAEISQYDYAMENVVGCADNEYQFSAHEWLRLYSWNSTEGHADLTLRYTTDVTNGYYIPVRNYEDDGSRTNTNDAADQYQDCIIDARDASAILGLSTINANITKLEDDAGFAGRNNDFKWSLVKGLEKKEGITVDPDSIITRVDVLVPRVESYDMVADSVTLYSNQTVTDAQRAKLAEFVQMKNTIREIDPVDDRIPGPDGAKVDDIRKAEVRIYIPGTNGSSREFRLVAGNDCNFYLKELDHEGIYTRLTYSSAEEGKLENETYHVQYFENDVNKKDLDATAIITSQTDEAIAYIDDVAMKADGTANSAGWYYPDVDNKKVVAKVYPFDTYNNTTYNGYVPKVAVKVTGERNGVCYEYPSIDWTFRRKVQTETENVDGSVTVVIEYNLPVDKNSIPSDWEPIYDEDGATIHKIKKVVKKGQDYDKDVTVKRNGSDDTVTTHVEKKWTLASIPKAGESMIVFAVIGVALFAVIAIRKKLTK